MGSDLHIEGDPTEEEQFYITLHFLENMTDYLSEFQLWAELEPQTIKDELTHANQAMTETRQRAGIAEPTGEVTLPQLHALSLRRLIAAYETKGVSPPDYERFVHLHAAIFLALNEEQEIERLMQTASAIDIDEELPF